jgi:pimeloyl-ACP methyl ester carboxylesterase
MTSYFKSDSGLKLAYRHVAGTGPTIVFLPGYMSDMAGGKATAVFDWAVTLNRNCLLLDYSGCGASEGDFKDGTLSRWRDEVLALIEHVGAHDVVLVGSSMGGWLMLLVGLALGDRLTGLVGIAAAPDFTDWGFTEAQKAVIRKAGVLYQPNPYGPEPTPTWAGFFNDGVANELLRAEIAISCPVRLIHGQADDDVPWDVSVKLAAALRSDDVRVTLIKDGDHRLSRESDIGVLLAAIDNILRQ